MHDRLRRFADTCGLSEPMVTHAEMQMLAAVEIERLLESERAAIGEASRMGAENQRLLERAAAGDEAMREMIVAARAADAKIARLRTALKPFADIADLVNHTDVRDDETVYRLPARDGSRQFVLLREDFRRAREASGDEQKADGK